MTAPRDERKIRRMAEGWDGLGRRAFLQGVGLALAAPAWVGCSSSGAKAGDAGIDAGAVDAPFGVWRAIREALRTSPDALADRAAALVAAKDAQGLFTFVRDEIATLPPVTSATERSRRWGTAATLRGGAGTPRERADLLASLLMQAGFSASVVSGTPNGDLAGGAAPATVYGRTFDRTFAPAPPPAGVDWVEQLTGAPARATTPSLEMLDPTGAAAQAIFDTLDKLLPAMVSARGGLYVVFDVPLVALDQGGTTTYLNPLSPNAVFGQPYADAIGAAPDADPLPTVQATLLASRASDPETQIPLVTATYTADELVGRQLFVQTQPSGSIEDLITSSVASVAAFIPTLSVGGVDLSADARSKLITTGPWVTQTGDLLARAADGTVTCNGLPLGDGTGASPSAVATLHVQANASAFPQVELTVAALDASAKPIAGLSASAFSVGEDGAPVSFLLRDNGVAGPRIVFLVDTTGSQPRITSAWAGAVAQAVFAAAPNAATQVVNLSAAMASPTGYTITDATSLAAALAAIAIGGVQSNLYGAILGAEAAAPTLVVLLSDGNADDVDLENQALTSLAGGAPVLAITCGTTPPVADSPVMDSFATASGGVQVDGADLSDPTVVATPLSQLVGGRVAAPYRLSYTAPTQGPAMRTVTVAAGPAPAGTASYDVPTQPTPQAAIAGLYLQLTLTTISGVPETYTRVLGGYVPKSGAGDPMVVKAAVADARLAMLGGVVISFEGPAPTLSTWLADSIAWRLATESASSAFSAGDAKAGFAALGDVPTTLPRQAVPLHAPPLPVANVSVYEESLRAVLFRVRPSATPLHADILPFTRLASASASGTDDYFRINLLASLRLAVAESATFKTSTASLLQGKALQLLPAGGVAATDLPQVPVAQVGAFVDVLNQYGDWLRFIASDGSTLAFWAVHPSTGNCLGVMPDGSGGGESPCSDYNGIATVFDIMALFSDIFGMPYLSVWAELGKLVALAGVETIMAFNNTPVVTNPDEQFNAVACSFGAGLAGSGPVGNALTKKVGGTTFISNLGQSLVITTVVGKFQVCAGNNVCAGK